jgi:HemK-like putative methylase
MRILELGTGTGCITLALANSYRRYHHNKKLHITACDINSRALRLARLNSRSTGMHESCIDIGWLQHDMRMPLPSPFAYDSLISNPPYISRTEYDRLEPCVKDWEDERALVGDRSWNEDGLSYYRSIAKLTQSILRPVVLTHSDSQIAVHRPIPFVDESTFFNDRIESTDGLPHVMPSVAVEIGGNHQSNAVVEIFRQHGLSHCTVWQDFNGQDRLITAMKCID